MSKIDHVGIAVKSIAEAARLYVAGLGLELERIETVSEQGVKVGFLPLGESEIELLEPLSAESTVAQFLEKRGEGLHHLCIEVPDIRAAMAHLREQGARLLSEEPSSGAGGSLVAFIHPRSANGVLLELSQKR
jgi:methylmalonyl-CoA epimerase